MNGKTRNPFEEGRLLLKPAAMGGYCVEIALAMSTGAGMKPLWAAFSREADSFMSELQYALRVKMKGQFDGLRLRLIAFGDLYMDQRPMQISPFFELPQAAGELAMFIRSIKPDGGEEKKSGLEALHCAMHSSWTRSGANRRHMVVLISDSSAYSPEEPLRRIDSEYGRRLGTYLPKENVPMPQTLDEMRRLWRDGAGTMDNWKHRLMVIAPESEPWRHMSSWGETMVIMKSKNQICKLSTAELVKWLAELV